MVTRNGNKKLQPKLGGQIPLKLKGIFQPKIIKIPLN